MAESYKGKKNEETRPLEVFSYAKYRRVNCIAFAHWHALIFELPDTLPVYVVHLKSLVIALAVVILLHSPNKLRWMAYSYWHTKWEVMSYARLQQNQHCHFLCVGKRLCLLYLFPIVASLLFGWFISFLFCPYAAASALLLCCHLCDNGCEAPTFKVTLDSKVKHQDNNSCSKPSKQWKTCFEGKALGQ